MNHIHTIKNALRVLLSLIFIPCCTLNAFAEQPPLRLEYDQPAVNWMTSALPIGNGTLGGMFFGGVQKEEMQFNDKTLWSGSTKIRGAYQNFGNLFLSFPTHLDPTDYLRVLDLDQAMGSVTYQSGGVNYLREYFASNPDSVIVMHLTTPNETAKLTFTVLMTDAHAGTKSITGNKITIKGILNLLSYEAQIVVLNQGGTVTSDATKISITNADQVTILLSAATNFSPQATTYVAGNATELHTKVANRIDRAALKTYQQLKENHLNDYCPQFNRVKLDLNAPKPAVTTDALVRTYKTNSYLDVLYFQYGRYLMLSSSRGVALPSNLQGLWNNSNSPAWECDIHSNINVQMNYWPAENTNLSECHLPFIDYVSNEALKPEGSWKKMAASLACRGWAIKTQNNIFGYSDWNWNRPANAWYCMHVWQHFAYTNDTVYLKEKAFPILRSTCEFWFDRLKKNAAGKWVAPDEWSPEQGPWEDGVAYAQQLVWELFTNTLKAATLLAEDLAFIDQLKEKLENLDNGVTIGSWGQIREWKIQNDVQGDTHRHLSQLIALYPGNQISYHLNSTYADAAKKSLISRGDGGTGWSRAWKISCWARLFDGDHAYKLLKAAQNLTYTTSVSMSDATGGVYENLFDAHPSFQIDGNFGATAGITEMLLQSNQGFIQLLPALPSVWSAGSYSGLKAEGNFTLDLQWRNSLPTECVIESGSGNDCKLYFPIIEVIQVKDAAGNTIPFTPENAHLISFATVKGARYTVTFGAKVPQEYNIIGYVQVDDQQKEPLTSVQITTGQKLMLLPECAVEGTWSWSGPNNFTSTAKELLLEGSIKQSGNYLVTHLANGIQSTLVFSVLVKSDKVILLNKIANGDYYIKKNGTELYWTNVNVTTSGSNPGGKPKLQVLNASTNPLAQVWNLTFDGNHYKLVNKADGRYVNEKGDFGLNAYYPDWNAFNVYNDGVACAIQVTEKSATDGTFFWEWTLANEIKYTTNTVVDPEKDLIFTFVPYESTGITNVELSGITIWGSNNCIQVNTDQVFKLSVYNQLGSLIEQRRIGKSTSIPFNKGIYIVKIEREGVSESIKLLVK